MTQTHHQFVSTAYGPRARDYLTSTVHSGGEDLELIEARVPAMRRRGPSTWVAAADTLHTGWRHTWQRSLRSTCPSRCSTP